MSEQEITVPDFYDVTPEAMATVDAALDPLPKPPENATVTIDKRNGDRYVRWSEALVLDQIESSRSPKGHTMILIRGKIKALGAPSQNVGKRVFSRYTINFPVLNGLVKDEGLEAMNNRSMAAVKTVLQATGYWPASGRLTADLLRTAFPPKNPDGSGTVTQSPLLAKVVIGNLVESPNKGEGAKRDRDTKAETYLPAPSA